MLHNLKKTAATITFHVIIMDGYGPVADYSQHGTELPNSIQGMVYATQLLTINLQERL
jgi:hypothetical protein